MLVAVLLTLSTLAPAQKADSEDAKVLERINFHRKVAGLKPVPDPALCKGCVAHAQYLVKNADHPSVQGLGGHSEDPKLPGYTEEGAKAAKSSIISTAKDLTSAVDWCMASLFHRLILLDPRVTRIGLGFVKNGDMSGIAIIHLPRSVVGTTSKPVMFPPVIYPGDQQKDVPLAFGKELPNPIPDSKDGKAGYPITVAFAPKIPITNVIASLKDGEGQAVPVWLSTPEKPAGGQTVFQQNGICLIAQAPLKPATTYTVNIEAKVNKADWKKTWTFTTGKE